MKFDAAFDQGSNILDVEVQEQTQVLSADFYENNHNIVPTFENDAELQATFGSVQVISGGDVSASVEQTNKGAVITITSKEGTSTATILHGKDGQPGKDGLSGKDGLPGVDGYTPIKGKDYFDGKDGKDGADGSPGMDGLTPHIGENGNWWIGETDTGVAAGGSGGSGGSGGTDMFAMSVDDEGNLYVHYNETEATPKFEMDADCNLYYVIEG